MPIPQGLGSTVVRECYLTRDPSIAYYAPVTSKTNNPNRNETTMGSQNSTALIHLIRANLPLRHIVDDKYMVIDHCPKYVTFERRDKRTNRFPSDLLRSHQGNSLTKGTTFRVTTKMVASTLTRLRAGEALERQASAPKGGISYTIGIARCVVAALGSLVREREDGRYVGGGSARIQRRA